MNTVAYLIGARPNIPKMAPVLRAMREQAPDLKHVVVHTDQHYDAALSLEMFRDLDMAPPDHHLHVGSRPHGEQTARALMRIESLLTALRPVALVVAGDVNSTLAGALAAAKMGIPVAHVESGLRSYDRRMPEEINRILVDHLSSWCFAHSTSAIENLEREGIDTAYLVGNTMIDSIVAVADKTRRMAVLERLKLEPQGYLLVTLHRPATVDGPLLGKVLRHLDRLSGQTRVVFPVHPRTAARIHRWGGCDGVELIDPLGYVDFLTLEAHASGVLTDSGGVQEETTYLKVPCFTLRDTTERPVTIEYGTNRLLGLDPGEIDRIPNWLSQPRPWRPSISLWDGHAGERVAEVLVESLVENRVAAC